MTKRSEDAQREREVLALRSVRNLVDEIEAEDRNRNARALKSLLWAGPLVIVVLAAGAWFFSPKSGRDAAKKQVPQMQLSQEAFAKARASYLAGPRRAYIGATMEPRFKTYVENCLAKIVRMANSSYKSEISGVSGVAELTLAVRFDGIIEAVEVHKSSGHDAMEPTAKRLVRMADTCGALPEEIRNDADVLHIRRTFELGQGQVTQR